MLVSSWKLEVDRINSVIKKWFANKGYFHIYDYFLDSNNWREEGNLTHILVNNRFLNLIQGLESYHKKNDSVYIKNVALHEKMKSDVMALASGFEELALWLSKNIRQPRENYILQERIAELIDQVSPIIRRLFGHTQLFDSFPDAATSQRHKLSHGDIESSNQGPAIVLLFHQAQFLLTILILRSLDFTDEDIVRLVEHNQNCQQQMVEIADRFKKN